MPKEDPCTRQVGVRIDRELSDTSGVWLSYCTYCSSYTGVLGVVGGTGILYGMVPVWACAVPTRCVECVILILLES